MMTEDAIIDTPNLLIDLNSTQKGQFTNDKHQGHEVTK